MKQAAKLNAPGEFEQQLGDLFEPKRGCSTEIEGNNMVQQKDISKDQPISVVIAYTSRHNTSKMQTKVICQRGALSVVTQISDADPSFTARAARSVNAMIVSRSRITIALPNMDRALSYQRVPYSYRCSSKLGAIAATQLRRTNSLRERRADRAQG